MLQVELKDGSKVEVQKGASVLEIAKSLSEGLARNATCALVDGEVVDLRFTVEKDCKLEILTFDNSLEGKKAYWHTSSHIMAQAIKRIYGNDVKLTIGPSTNNTINNINHTKAFIPSNIVIPIQSPSNVASITYFFVFIPLCFNSSINNCKIKIDNVTNNDRSKELRLIYSFCIMFGNIEYAVIPRTDNISLFDTLNIIFFIMNAISTFKIK